jgi:hypothetical protein
MSTDFGCLYGTLLEIKRFEGPLPGNFGLIRPGGKR